MRNRSFKVGLNTPLKYSEIGDFLAEFDKTRAFVVLLNSKQARDFKRYIEMIAYSAQKQDRGEDVSFFLFAVENSVAMASTHSTYKSDLSG